MAKGSQPKQGPPLRAGDGFEFPPHEVSALRAIPENTFELIERICGVGRNPYRDGGEDGRRATDYYCGRLSVAHLIRALRESRLTTNTRGAPPDLPNSPTPAPQEKI